MLDTLKALDERLLLYLNGLHNPFLDQAMWLFSDRFFWIPLYALFLVLLYKQFPTKYWTVLLTVVVMIVVSDQLCNLSKDHLLRLRPSNEPHLIGLVHTVNDYTGGMYGFYSGHAANSFAVAVFLILLVSKRYRYIIPVALAYALFTAYSRIYLGVHYPGDVLTGIVIGSLTGLGFAKAYIALRHKYFNDRKRTANNKYAFKKGKLINNRKSWR